MANVAFRIKDSELQKVSEFIDCGNIPFKVNYAPKRMINYLCDYVEKIASGDSRPAYPEDEADAYKGIIGYSAVRHFETDEAIEMYVDFIKVCLIFTKRELMEYALQEAQKKADGTLTGRRVNHITFTGISVNSSFYELCGVNESPNVLTLEIRRTDTHHSTLEHLDGKKTPKEILADWPELAKEIESIIETDI